MTGRTKLTHGKFTGLPLDHVDVKHGSLYVRLQKPIHYFARDGSVYTVPVGFVTDYSSIPRWAGLWPEFDRLGRHRPSGALHDMLLGSEVAIGAMTKARADYLFRESLNSKEVNMSWFGRWVMWAAVRAWPYLKSAWAWFTALVGMVSSFFKPRRQRRAVSLLGLPSLNMIAMIAVAVGCLTFGFIAGKWWGAWGAFSRGDAAGYARAMNENADATRALNDELDAVNGELAAIEASEKTSEIEAREKLASVVFGENECRALDETERSALAIIGGN